MILVIDNYDSFTYNIVEYLHIIGQEVMVYRNDKIRISDIHHLSPDQILISPGPGSPNEAGITLDVIREFKGRIPIFGVCLGHQAIGQAFGAEVVKADSPVHGKVSQVYHDGKTIYQGLPNPLTVTRYHSLIVRRDRLPDCLEISGETEDGIVMSVRHKEYPIEGVQFHPESILTSHGIEILKNFFSHIKLQR